MKCRRFRLIVLLPALLVSVAGAAAFERGPRVMLEASLDPPEAGSTWVLTVLTDYGEPGMVTVTPPDFGEGIILEQVLQGSRLVSLSSWLGGAAHAYERWTATEYRFVLRDAGRFTFGAFGVVTPVGSAATQPFVLDVRTRLAVTGPVVHPARWHDVPQAVATGESVVITLSLNPGVAPPSPGLFMPEVPPGHILESLPVGAAEALRLRLIPLEAGVFRLPPRRFTHAGAVFDIPPLAIPVTQSPARLVVGPVQADALVPAVTSPGPFPPADLAAAANPRLHQRHRGEFEAAHLSAQSLWERGYRANALALLRQYERDHRAGALFAAVRREAEASLGLTGTRDERRGLTLPFTGGRSAVLRETPVRRIPDAAGEEIARFGEGQRVTIEGNFDPASWVRVTADGGATGWVPAQAIILF